MGIWATQAAEMVKKSGSIPGLMLAGATAFSTFGTAVFGAGLAMKLFGISLRTIWLGGGIAAGIIAAGAAFGYLVSVIQKNDQAMRALGEISENVIRGFNALWEENQGIITAAKEIVVGYIVLLAEKIAEVMDWLSLMSTNWDLTWALMAANVSIVMYTIIQEATIAFNTMTALAMASVATVVDIFVNMGKAIAHVFETVYHTLVGLFRGIGDIIGVHINNIGAKIMDSLAVVFRQMQEATDRIPGMYGYSSKSGKIADSLETKSKELRGREKENPLGGFMEEVNKIDSEMPDILGSAGKKFVDVFAESMGSDEPYKDQLAELKQRSANVRGAMEKERTRRRDLKAKEEEEKKSKPVVPELDPESGSFVLGQGATGFAELGKKVQDQMFKDAKDDKVEFTNKLLTKNNEFQEKILAEAQKEKDGTAKLTGED